MTSLSWSLHAFLLVFLLIRRTCASNEQIFSAPLTDIEIDEPYSLRAGFSNSSDYENATVLLQEYGNVDVIKTFFLEVSDELTISDIQFSQSSSDENVLSVPSADNLIVTSSSGHVNVTAMLSFDGMVGKTEYTLNALRKGTNEVVATITISFVIAGMTFYVEQSPGNRTIVSGDNSALVLSYEENLSPEVTSSEKIRVLLQYANGTSSDEMGLRDLPFLFGMQSSLAGYAGQCSHDATQCDPNQLGVESSTGEIQLPAGCGYGFYEDAQGNLLFGIDFAPYRAGNFSILYSSTEFAPKEAEVSGEIFEFAIHISILGDPPIVVQTVGPDKLWRQEGGEVLTIEMFNADLYSVSFFQLWVEQVANAFRMIPSSYSAKGAPSHTQELSFITEPDPNAGVDLNCSLEYVLEDSSPLTSIQETLRAVTAPGMSYLLSYDSRSLSIGSMLPSFGKDEGGTEITIKGYFPHFDVDVDGIYFSGQKLSRQYILAVTNDSLTILSPPKSELGSSYEFLVSLRMGNAVSNSMLFSFVLDDAVVRISQSGTSEINDETYTIGDCIPVTFTAVVSPFTNQVQSYQWTLHLITDPGSDLLQTVGFENANSSAQTLVLDPDVIAAGPYTLTVSVSLQGQQLMQEILLMRENKLSIGAFILDAPERSISHPDSPLRLSAVVRPPGECYQGNQTMLFEWTAFGDTQTFSSKNATGSPLVSNFSTTPARLGWEYMVPKENLTPGNHSIVFRVWMAERETVSGQAISHVVVTEGSLVALIRYGEEQVSVNYMSTLSLFGTRSYDPDVVEGDNTVGLSYEWTCRQSASQDFSEQSSTPCLPALISNDTGMSFSAPISVLEALVDIQYLQYSLVVRKENRASPSATLVVEIQNRGTKPFLDDYQISLSSAEGTSRGWDAVSHYERNIISVQAASAASWTYALIEPSVPDFFAPSNLINSPLFFSADASLFTVSGNTKPLGIEAGKLNPFTTYKFKILFDGGAEHEATSVVVSLRTTEAPVIGFPLPSVMEGTTNTTFTVTAGIPRRRAVFSYYFILTDKDGNSFCVGGCTGYDVSHFKIGRPGTYSLSAYIFDMQGKALLDSDTLTENITIAESGEQQQYSSTLATLFDNGDDSTWTQLAHDLALILLEPEPVPGNVRELTGLSNHQDATEEDMLAAQMQHGMDISNGARKIFCSSFPNSFHGTDCMSLASDLAELPQLDTETLYNLMVTVECCVQNTPPRTINKMGPMFPMLLQNLNRVARQIDQGGVSRRRLLSTTGVPANVLADVQSWTSREMLASVTSGQLDGFTGNYSIGEQNEFGQISVVVASNPGHMPVALVNGQQRQVVMGLSGDEVFYAKDACLTSPFSTFGEAKRYFVLYTLDNFLLDGFQDPPRGTNLADNLYWVHIFERDADGRFVQVEIPREEPCFCWRLPVVRKQQFLEDSTEYMAGMFSVTDLKDFGVDASAKGEKFSYVYDGIVTTEYNGTEGWVEACQDQVGLVSSTLVERSSNNALGNGSGTVVGTGTVVIVALVIGSLMFVVVAMASAWIFAARAMSDVAAPLAALAPSEMYVERDVYGRGTIFDSNAVSLPSGD